MEPPRNDVVVEESAGPTIAQEQLRRKNIGRSYEKMLLKCGITKSERKVGEESRAQRLSIPFAAKSQPAGFIHKSRS